MNFNEYCHSVIDHYPEYVTQKEMCAILGICTSTAYSIQKKGIIPFEYVNTSEGRRQRIKTRLPVMPVSKDSREWVNYKSRH